MKKSLGIEGIESENKSKSRNSVTNLQEVEKPEREF